MRFTIINGPNLNLLGKREPDIYGDATFDSHLKVIRAKYDAHEIEYFQSNVEGEIVTAIQTADAAAYTHTSVAIGDAVAAISSPVIEVHISNIFAREPFRHSSFIAPHAIGIIAGFGLAGYDMAIAQFLNPNP